MLVHNTSNKNMMAFDCNQGKIPQNINNHQNSAFDDLKGSLQEFSYIN